MAIAAATLSSIKSAAAGAGVPGSQVDAVLAAVVAQGFDVVPDGGGSAVELAVELVPESAAVIGRPGLSVLAIPLTTVGWLVVLLQTDQAGAVVSREPMFVAKPSGHSGGLLS